MKQVTVIFTAILMLSFNLLNAQNHASAKHYKLKMAINEQGYEIESNWESFEENVVHNLTKLEEALNLKLRQFDVHITFNKINTSNDNTFFFLGEKFTEMNELEERIDSEEEEMKQNGYFQFMEEWYPSIEKIDNDMLMEKMEAGYFQFLGEYYPPIKYM